MSVKFQVTLPEPLILELKHEAEKLGVSAAELIRQTMADRLRRKMINAATDPFESLTGLLMDSAETDLSSRIDQVLYE